MGPAFTFPSGASTARYPLQLGRLEQCEEVSCSRTHNHWCCLTFPNYTAGSTGAMWVKFLLKETTANSIIWESNLDLLDHWPIPNHCMLLPYCMSIRSDRHFLSTERGIILNPSLNRFSSRS